MTLQNITKEERIAWDAYYCAAIMMPLAEGEDTFSRTDAATYADGMLDERRKRMSIEGNQIQSTTIWNKVSDVLPTKVGDYAVAYSGTPYGPSLLYVSHQPFASKVFSGPKEWTAEYWAEIPSIQKACSLEDGDYATEGGL